MYSNLTETIKDPTLHLKCVKGYKCISLSWTCRKKLKYVASFIVFVFLHQ